MNGVGIHFIGLYQMGSKYILVYCYEIAKS